MTFASPAVLSFGLFISSNHPLQVEISLYSAERFGTDFKEPQPVRAFPFCPSFRSSLSLDAFFPLSSAPLLIACSWAESIIDISDNFLFVVECFAAVGRERGDDEALLPQRRGRVRSVQKPRGGRGG